MKSIIKDSPSITYIVHGIDGKDDRTVTVYKPTMEYYLVFELIRFCRLPHTIPDLGITIIKDTTYNERR